VTVTLPKLHFGIPDCSIFTLDQNNLAYVLGLQAKMLHKYLGRCVEQCDERGDDEREGRLNSAVDDATHQSNRSEVQLWLVEAHLVVGERGEAEEVTPLIINHASDCTVKTHSKPHVRADLHAIRSKRKALALNCFLKLKQRLGELHLDMDISPTRLAIKIMPQTWLVRT
jgi:hypothetical protein